MLNENGSQYQCQNFKSQAMLNDVGVKAGGDLADFPGRIPDLARCAKAAVR
jgi:hypothetical protein